MRDLILYLNDMIDLCDEQTGCPMNLEDYEGHLESEEVKELFGEYKVEDVLIFLIRNYSRREVK